MNEISPKDKQESGIEIDAVTFDVNGEVTGIDQSILESIAGGLQISDGNCVPLPNDAC